MVDKTVSMIKVTCRDGSQMYLNCDLIESISEAPDTHILLSNGNRYIVMESAPTLVQRIRRYKASILRQGLTSKK
jgi:flagellar protein FlbD